MKILIGKGSVNLKNGKVENTEVISEFSDDETEQIKQNAYKLAEWYYKRIANGGELKYEPA